MTEALIICNQECEIKDLNLRMVRGQEQSVGVNLARGSRDLRAAVASGKVTVRYCVVTRQRIARRPPANYIRKNPPPKPRPKPRPERPYDQKTEFSEQDTKQPAPTEVQKDKSQLLEMKEYIKASISEEISKALANAEPSLSEERLVSVLTNVLKEQSVNLGGSTRQTSVVSSGSIPSATDEPMYIPSGIVDTETKSEISLTEESKGSEDLDETARLLREMRKNRRKR